MNAQIKTAIYFIGLGMSLVAYAHFNFAQKEEVQDVKLDMREIKQDVKELLQRTPKP